MDVSSIIRAARESAAIRLDLRGAALVEFPTEILGLADSLEILDLSDNRLSALPEEFSRLHRLRILFCSENRFEELPPVLGRCATLEMIGFKANQIVRVAGESLPPRLRWLILTDNRLEHLPGSIGRCIRLQKLMLAGNCLESLPDEMAACVNLELIRLAANRFRKFPEWLFKLPRLSWLAVAGNPWLELPEPEAMTAISWNELEHGAVLGQGASGVIWQADWNRHGVPSHAVAVKVFKGEMTSDGLPEEEMAACLAAGNHPNLIGVLGKIHDHPQGGMGLVLPLVGAEFRNLAGPPDFNSCTRDVYSAETRLGAGAVLSMLLGTASALKHLHQRRIAHGDFYAHNLLHDDEGRCLLGDFGAASFYLGEVDFERIEVRAFGCLMEELWERVDPLVDLEEIGKLRQQCLREQVDQRPDFREICAVLEGLVAG